MAKQLREKCGKIFHLLWVCVCVRVAIRKCGAIDILCRCFVNGKRDLSAALMMTSKSFSDNEWVSLFRKHNVIFWFIWNERSSNSISLSKQKKNEEIHLMQMQEQHGVTQRVSCVRIWNECTSIIPLMKGWITFGTRNLDLKSSAESMTRRHLADTERKRNAFEWIYCSQAVWSHSVRCLRSGRAENIALTFSDGWSCPSPLHPSGRHQAYTI